MQHAAFADLGGWSLTERGRAQNERLLAAELARVGGADEVRDVYRDFLPLNARLQRACTDWQLRPTADDRLAVNDHSDPAWDTRVLDELAAIEQRLTPLAARLGGSSPGSADTTRGSPRRCAAPEPATTAGSTAPTSTPATASGSSSTKTSSPRSASTATRIPDAQRRPCARKTRSRISRIVGALSSL